MKLDKLDLAILVALEADARLSFAALAEIVGISKTPCWKRVQALEAAGAIRGYRAVVAPKTIGLGVQALVQVMIDFAKRAEFEAGVLADPAILECHTTAGEADYILKIASQDVDDLDTLLRMRLSLLPGVQRSTTLIFLKAVKEDGALTLARGGSRPQGFSGRTS